MNINKSVDYLPEACQDVTEHTNPTFLSPIDPTSRISTISARNTSVSLEPSVFQGRQSLWHSYVSDGSPSLAQRRHDHH
jgi:hypothetical protein